MTADPDTEAQANAADAPADVSELGPNADDGADTAGQADDADDRIDVEGSKP